VKSLSLRNLGLLIVRLLILKLLAASPNFR